MLTDRTAPCSVRSFDEVVSEIPAGIRPYVQPELLKCQIEIAGPPATCIEELRHSLIDLRGAVVNAADRVGARVLAAGTSPFPGIDYEITDRSRMRWAADRYGAVLTNGLHVHVGVPDAETGIKVLNYIRPWLPVLHALSANSPFVSGVDSGHASSRSVLWESSRPSARPTPYFESPSHYRDLVAAYTERGESLDEGMVYWYSRLSSRYPTVELRMSDVSPSVDETILIAALSRALVGMGLSSAGRRPGIRWDERLLLKAHRTAARDGLDGASLTLEHCGPGTARQQVIGLFRHVKPELQRHGDLTVVASLLRRVFTLGSGSARQRALHQVRGVQGLLDHATLRGQAGP